jgi:hypothetical protein
MSKWPMRGHFRYLRFKTFLMTPRAPQCKVFWALLSNSKHSGVPEDSKSATLEVLGFTLTLGQSGVATTNFLSSTPHTCQLVWAQWASARIKTSTYTSICISFPPKISFVVVIIVALKCSEKSLGIENSFVNHAACCKFQLVLIDTIMTS